MPVGHTTYNFAMAISQDDYQRYYRGSAQSIVVNTREGVRVQFPASALRPYVTMQGVSGQFVLTMDENNKLVSLQKLG